MEKLTNTRTDVASFSSPRSPLSNHQINDTTYRPHLKSSRLLKIFRIRNESAMGEGRGTNVRTKRFFFFSASSDYGVYISPQACENKRAKEWHRWTVTIEVGGKKTSRGAIITLFHHEASADQSRNTVRLGGELDVVAYFGTF